MTTDATARAPEAARARGGARTLADRFDARRNSLTMLRLGLALSVAFVHALAVGFGHQPWIGSATVGDLAVDGFFVLSGFLVTRSLLRLPTVRRYAWHRFLRIMPGFWVCLVVTAVAVAPVVAVLSGRPALSVWTVGDRSALDYLVRNSALLMVQFDIAGLPAEVPTPGAMDGSLWTLFYEACCYALVLGLGLAGLLGRRRILTLGLATGLWAATVANSVGLVVVGQERLLRFTFLFLLGGLAWVFAHRVPIRGRLAAASAAVLVPSLLLLPDYRALAAPAFAYLCLYAVVALPLRQNPSWDLSYGLYIYHWPVQQVLVLLGLAAWGEPAFVAVSLLLATGAAAVSWKLVEGPSLGLKDAAWVDRWRGQTLVERWRPRSATSAPAAVGARRRVGRRGGRHRRRSAPRP